MLRRFEKHGPKKQKTPREIPVFPTFRGWIRRRGCDIMR